MTLQRLATAFFVTSALAVVPALAADNVAIDQTMTIAGMETACTGVGLEAREDAKWKSWPLLIEFVGKEGQMLGDSTVTVSGNGHDVAMHCAGPWSLMKLPAGSYHISADVAEGGHKEMNVKVPASGQTHLTVRYPNAGGAESSERVAAR
jgi:hypothetical protein